MNKTKSVLIFMPSLLIALRMCFLLHVIPKRNISNTPKSIRFTLRRICDSNEKIDVCNEESQS